MEDISPEKLSKYKSILDQIDEEYKRQESLKKAVEKETDKLIAVRVSLQENFSKLNVFRVFVKLFDSLFDLHNVYGPDLSVSHFEELPSSCTLGTYKFYLVEVCVSKLFLSKIAVQQWLLNVRVTNSRASVSKSVHFGGAKRGRETLLSNRIYVVVPLYTSTYEPSVVSCHLFMPLDQMWSAVELASIYVDVSYHLTSLSSVSHQFPVDSWLVNLARRRYNVENDAFKIQKCLNIAKQIDYKFKCTCSMRHLFEIIVKNCYHRLSVQALSAFMNKSNIEGEEKINGEDVILDLTNSQKWGNSCDAVHIRLNRAEDRLSLRACATDLYQLKKYVINEIKCRSDALTIERVWLVSLRNLKNYLQCELNESQMGEQNLRIVYEELRRLIFELPV